MVDLKIITRDTYLSDSSAVIWIMPIHIFVQPPML